MVILHNYFKTLDFFGFKAEIMSAIMKCEASYNYTLSYPKVIRGTKRTSGPFPTPTPRTPRPSLNLRVSIVKGGSVRVVEGWGGGG